MSSNRIWLPLFLLVLIGVSGCSVEMVSTRDDRRGGVIRYQLTETFSQNQSRREKAYKEMHTYCNGNYRISREGLLRSPDENGESPLPGHSSWQHGSDKDAVDWYIHFDCESTDNPATSTNRLNPSPK